MSKADTWMPIFISEYLADTMHLNAQQHGAYLMLLFHHWRSGSVPDDDAQLSAIARCDMGSWKKSVGPVVRTFFSKEGGVLIQKRALAEREVANELVDKRSQAGKEGAAKRWGRDRKNDGPANGNRIANALVDAERTQSQTDAPLPLPLPISSLRSDNNSCPPEPASFAEFWAAYPRKEGKAKAEKAHKAALRKIKHPEMMAALAKFPWPADRQFIPHAATWLNGERWLDQPELGATPQQSGPRSASIFDIPGVIPYHEDGRAVLHDCDLVAVTERVLELAQLRREPTLDDHRIVAGWITPDVELSEIYNLIRGIAMRSNYTTPVSLKFFDKAVRERGNGAAA
jgi:uncharacterized protein YdaU (DUF1376 family)